MQSFKNAIAGRTKLRYHFEIVPKSVEGVQCQHDVSVVCESGSKISYTEPKAVSTDGVASFSSVMRMTATIYKDKHTLVPKEYTFKVQSVRATGSSLLSDARRKTIARAKINLADYCTHSSTPAATEVQLPLKPHGVLNLSIRAVWLQHYPEEKKDSRSSDTSSAAELSSQFSSASGGDSLHGEAADRSHSVNLDDLADHHHHHQQQQHPTAAGQSPYMTPALKAHLPPHHQQPHQQPVSGPRTTLPGRASSAALADTGRSSGSAGSSRHKRSVSTPAAITPILELDREGFDPASSLDRTLSETLEAQSSSQTLQQLQQHRPEDYLGLVHEDSATAAAAALAAAAAEEEGPARVLSLPAWMWPFGSNSVQGATTDQLMRQIEASSTDAPKLQRMCKALLCERNEWRYKATQWERNAGSLQQQIDQLQQSKAGLLQQLQGLESQLQQLQTNALVDDLVVAKLQFAEAQEQIVTLQGHLNKEKDKTRRLAAQLTAVESKYAMMYEQQAAAAAVKQQQSQATNQGMPQGAQEATAASAGEQGEGLHMVCPSDAGSAVALAAGPNAGRRGSHTGGWGSMFMRAGSYMMGTGAGSGTAQQQQQQQQGGTRRTSVSEPGGARDGFEHAAAQATPRHSLS